MLSDEEIYEVIPRSFMVFCKKININLYDELLDDDDKNIQKYADWNEVTNEIRLAKTVYGIDLDMLQLKASYYHELGHCIQSCLGLDMSESHAEMFSNFMVEYLSTKIH